MWGDAVPGGRPTTPGGPAGAAAPGGAVGPAGFGWITVWCQERSGRACGPFPILTVGGHPHRGVWNAPTSLQVPVGGHRVEVLPRRFTGLPPAVLQVVVGAGQEVRLRYRAPNALGFGARLERDG